MNYIIIIITLLILIGGIAVSAYIQNKIKSNMTEAIKYLGTCYHLPYNSTSAQGTYKNNHIYTDYEITSKKKYFTVRISPVKLKNNKNFRLSITHKTITEMFDNNYLLTYYDNFDSSYIITSTNSKRTIAVLNSKALSIIEGIYSNISNFKLVNNIFELKILNGNHFETKFYIDQLLILSDILFSEEDTDSLLLKNIKSGSNKNQRIQNIKYLFQNKNNIDLYKDTLNKLQDDHQIEISIFSSILLGEEGKEKLIKIINNDPGVFEADSSILLKLIIYFENNEITLSKNWMLNMLSVKNEDIKIAIIKALKKTGDITVVEHLLPFIKGFHSPEIKLNAQHTVNYLQKNTQPGERGNLSVSDIDNSGEMYINEEKSNGNLSIED